MLIEAIKKYIDVKKSYMIGDSFNDYLASRKLNLNLCVGIKKNLTLD